MTLAPVILAQLVCGSSRPTPAISMVTSPNGYATKNSTTTPVRAFMYGTYVASVRIHGNFLS